MKWPKAPVAGSLKPRPLRVRSLLILVLLVVVLPGLVEQIGFHYVRFEQRRAQEIDANLEMAQAVAAAFDAYVQAAVRQELAMGLALIGPPSRTPEEVSDYMAEVIRPFPALGNSGWIDPKGFPIGGAINTNPTSMAERPFFRAILAGAEWSVSDLQQSRLDGRLVVIIARGMRDQSGTLLGVVTMAVDPTRLGEAIGVKRTQGGSYSLVDGQRRIVYSYPETPMTWEERLMPEFAGSLIASTLAGEVTSGTAFVPRLGERRVSAATPLRSVRWVVIASRSEAEVLAPLRADLVRDFSLLGLTALAAIIIALVLGRTVTGPLQRLQAQAAALGRHELDRVVTVSGPLEVQDLAATFNVMAEQIRRYEDQREVYLQTISHDLRTPMTALLGHAQLLRRALQRAENEGDAQRAEAVITAAGQMDAMIRDLADSAHIEAGQVRLQLQTVDMGALVAQVKDRLEVNPGGERIRVEAAEALVVQADPHALERVLGNLLTNALKYSAPDADIIVTVVRQGHEVVTAVSDRGPGIAAEELPRLFDRYHRTREARETREGLGLGLYITRGLVEAHAGRIWVESTYGEGSRFLFTLPAPGGPAVGRVTLAEQ